MSSFAERLRAYRIKKGLSMKALSEKIDVPLSTYREWEYGRAIKGEPYLKLADALGVSVYELLGRKCSDKETIFGMISSLENELEQLKKALQSLV